MRSLLGALSGLVLAGTSLAAPQPAPVAAAKPATAVAAKPTIGPREPYLVSMTLEPVTQVDAIALTRNYQPLLNYLGQASGVQLRMVYSHDPTQELINTRISKFALVIGPSHVVGSALRYGYEPAAAFPGQQRMVFVALKDSGIASIESARGKRLGLPPSDSLATYMARGELSAMGIKSKQYFREIRNFSLHESTLYALGFGAVDVAVADASFAQDWLMRQGGTVIHETPAVPFVAVAIDSRLPTDLKDRLRNALLHPTTDGVRALASLNIGEMRPIAREDYQYVSTLGYFTPTVLPGATVITAEQARDMMAKGAVLYDVRTERDWREKHIKGAVWVPYEEGSRKEIEFDRTLDRFALERLPADRNAKIVFSCNGFECWKSYKAAVLAIDAKYRNVFWLRGGFPEWNARGFPVE